MANKNNQLVLAFFENEAAADAAVESLKAWDKANDTIKLGGIGVLVKDEDGKIKQHKLGPRAIGAGIGVGLVLGLLVALLPGVVLLAGLTGGAIAGGVAGSLFHQAANLSEEDLARYDAELDNGRAAVGVMCDEDEVEATVAQLTGSGGTPAVHAVSDEGMAQAEAAAATAPEATAPDLVPDVVPDTAPDTTAP